jgi:plastocyanin
VLQTDNPDEAHRGVAVARGELHAHEDVSRSRARRFGRRGFRARGRAGRRDPRHVARSGRIGQEDLRREPLSGARGIDGPTPAGRPPDSLFATSRTGQLAQKDQSFSPRVVPVAVGGQIEFPNRDPIYHNVFSVSPAKRFDLGKYGRGKSKSVRFDKPGVVKVYCDIHSNMEGFIVVVPNAWFTRVADDGSFELPPLPSGTYRVQAWHPDLGTKSVSVTVGEDETRSIEVAF